MWDTESLRAMNEEAARRAKLAAGIVNSETLYQIGRHEIVDKKTYQDGHSLYTCRENGCQALSEEDLKLKPCGKSRRSPGW